MKFHGGTIRDPRRALRVWLALGVCLFVTLARANAQALTIAEMGQGTEVVVVTQPFADMAFACWSDGQGPECITATDLVFLADLEQRLATGTPPPALVVIGGSGRLEVVDLARRLFGGRSAARALVPPTNAFSEGGQERRLGPPGSVASLRLQVPLPPPQTPLRSAVTVLWRLLPRALESEHPDVRARVEGDRAELEISLADETPDLAVRQLRLSLARFGADPDLKADDVEAEAYRLRIDRRARLERGETAARELLRLWGLGGADAVREYLFGPDGVTLSSVREAARIWLAQHPGHAVVVLPPQVFSPRFVPAPQEVQLENDVTVAALERPGAGLSALVVRPVVLSSLTGDVESVVLARVARLLRSQSDRPPFITVESMPPRLELAAGEDDFSNLCESIQEALETIASDQQEVSPGDDARSRSLRLMSGVLGYDAEAAVTPAAMLTPGNLALGVVAPDAEAAFETLRKFGIGGPPRSMPPVASTVGASPRRRIPAAGTRAAVVIAGEISADFPAPECVASLIRRRIGALFADTRVEVFSPLVPGRSYLVVVVEREDTVDALETSLKSRWHELVAPATEAELEAVRREVARETADFASGVLGRARACAQVAAGVDRWRSPADREMATMTIAAETVDAALAELSDPALLEWTASGPLPVAMTP